MVQVVVMMSSYNGEKYIVQQIDSILRQNGVNVKLVIRDDGSSDNTIKIIKEYIDRNSNVILIEGKNIGAKNSFFELSKQVPSADFYAFADQDDVWKPDKLYYAVKSLEKLSGCGLYTSSYDVVDKNLNVLKKNAAISSNYTMCESIMYRAPLGCTIVMNKKLFEIYRMSTPLNFRMHDHWAILTAHAINAEIVIDKRVTMLYRQHENNVVGGDSDYKTRIRRLVNSAIYNKNERQEQACSVFDNYSEYLNEFNYSILKSICLYRTSIFNRLKLLFDKRFKIANKKTQLLFKIAVLFGVF